MGLFDVFRPKKENLLEMTRRDFLEKNGRITDGTIIDTDVSESGEEIAFYYYSVHGVNFESSEVLTEEQRRNPLLYAPGAKIGVRFDPKNHGNSILV